MGGGSVRGVGGLLGGRGGGALGMGGTREVAIDERGE